MTDTFSSTSRPSTPEHPKQGPYVDLPLPASWEALLSGLQPVFATPPTTVLRPDLGEMFDAHLGMVNPRDQLLLLQRYGQDHSICELRTMYSVSRQYIYHQHQQAVKPNRHTWRRTLDVLMQALCPHGASWLDFSTSSSALFPQTSSDELWKTLYGLHQLLSPGTYILQAEPQHRWLLCWNQAPNLQEALKLLKTSGAPALPEHLAQQTGCSVQVLLSAPNHTPNLFLTRNSQLALKSWNVRTWSVIAAQELARQSVTEWHYSEMARALEFILPERFQGLCGRNVSSVMTDARRVFAPAGRMGIWRLTQHGDGHQTTSEAISAVLGAADKPLSAREVHDRLERNVNIGSVHQILTARQEFRSVRTGGYTLSRPGATGRFGPEAFHAEEALLARMFNETGQESLTRDAVIRAALSADLDPLRVELSTGFSQAHVFSKTWEQYVLAGSDTLLSYQFLSWYGQRRTLDSQPKTPVVIAALREARRCSGTQGSRGTWARRIQNTRAFFEERGWVFPEEHADHTPGQHKQARPDPLPHPEALNS